MSDLPMISALREAVNQAQRQFPESFGSPRLDGFKLHVLPPWCDYTEDEILRIEITSAAVCCITDRGVLLTHMVDEGSFLDRWDLPGGGKNVEDESPEALARREFYEETGIDPSRLIFEPFGYAFREKRKRNRGGLQYLTFADIPIPQDHTVDDLGRIFFPPFSGALTKEVNMLVLEPLEVFMSSRSILHSPNSWAYRMMYSSLSRRLGRILG